MDNTNDPKKALYRNTAVKPPTIDDLSRLSRDYGLCLTDSDLGEFKDYIQTTLKAYDKLDQMISPTLPVKYPRTSGYRPRPEDNKYNAWYWRCDISGASEGILKGRTVGIKDNVGVAGIPMMVGSRIIQGLVANEDATVVTRILDAGGRILGKTTTEHFCMGVSSWSSDTGPILNPHDVRRSTGGSSGGSAVAVYTGDVDMALGTDQGGSIRSPASWCGLVGLKPTYGLVPYTGIGRLESALDHVGPIARTVRDCALLLEAISGYDEGRDSRQPLNLKVPKYSQELNADIRGLRIGLVTEGFECCDPGVQEVVRQAAMSLSSVGGAVEDVSIPMHADGAAIIVPMTMEGYFKCALEGCGQGYNSKGHYSEGLITKMHEGLKTLAKNGSDLLKLRFLMGGYVTQTYGNRFYAKAQNMTLALTGIYDKVLQQYDVLVMPTLPCTATLLPTEGSSITDRLKTAFGIGTNMVPFNCTGHPALTINAGQLEELPVGMTIVGKHFEDVTVLNVAYAFEKIRDANTST